MSPALGQCSISKCTRNSYSHFFGNFTTFGRLTSVHHAQKFHTAMEKTSQVLEHSSAQLEQKQASSPSQQDIDDSNGPSQLPGRVGTAAYVEETDLDKKHSEGTHLLQFMSKMGRCLIPSLTVGAQRVFQRALKRRLLQVEAMGTVPPMPARRRRRTMTIPPKRNPHAYQ